MTIAAEPQLESRGTAVQDLDRLVGTWQVWGETEGIVQFEWLPGGHFLLQHVDLVCGDEHIAGVEVIGHDKPFGAEPSPEVRSRFYSNTGDTLEYVYELDRDVLLIWAGETGSPAYFRGTFDPTGSVCTGAWTYPGGVGETAVMTRLD
ncbi:MAG: hypothetical protein ACRDO2_09235 [Nocardioidaceae bacterium]